ncbi:urease accessory protein UreF [Sneathiella glossodoripedis]|uniref:urease accessory protein UreF n=1 Tax=Sneathiella glossodoripedis TaxID=418853 RepID=UPI000471563F|nr:urease accessory protein UreF [Sneathiella glossodoripedis]
MNLTAIYELMSWMSPSYPVGAYTYSHGIEQAVEDGLINNVSELQDWISAILEYGSGRNDGILFCETFRAVQATDPDRLYKVAELAYAIRPTKELELETTAQGRAFMTITERSFPSQALANLKEQWAGPIAYPVVVGAAAAGRDMTIEVALTGYIHGFVSNLVSAAVRLVPLGQTDGQLAIAALEEKCAELVQEVLFSTLDDLGSATLMVDWCSARHETQYTRLFRS